MNDTTPRSTGDESGETELVVEFRRDIAGYRKLDDGTHEAIEFPQWILMVNGIQWGYVSKKTGSPIHLIRHIDARTKERIQEKVIQLVGDRSPVVMPPEPEPEPEPESDDDDDDEYDAE